MRPAAALVIVVMSACGGDPARVPSPAPSSPVSIRISLPEDGWAQSIEYEAAGDGTATLVLDGVRFALRDPSAYVLDWSAAGMEGITISVAERVLLTSTTPAEGAFLVVAGKAVTVREGAVVWGEQALPLAPGDTVVVDASGLRVQRP